MPATIRAFSPKELFHVPPDAMVRSPPNVLVPAVEVEKIKLPAIVVVPVTVKLYPITVNEVPLPMDKLPPTAKS